MVGGSIETWTWSSDIPSAWGCVSMIASYGDELIFSVKGQAWRRTAIGLRLADP